MKKNNMSWVGCLLSSYLSGLLYIALKRHFSRTFYGGRKLLLSSDINICWEILLWGEACSWGRLDHNYKELKTEQRGWGKKKEKKRANLKNVLWYPHHWVINQKIWWENRFEHTVISPFAKGWSQWVEKLVI